MIRKFCKHLVLHAAILAFAGPGATPGPGEPVQHSAAVAGAQALDQLGMGVYGVLFGAAVYQVITGPGP